MKKILCQLVFAIVFILTLFLLYKLAVSAKVIEITPQSQNGGFSLVVAQAEAKSPNDTLIDRMPKEGVNARITRNKGISIKRDSFVKDYVMAEAKKAGVNPLIADFIISHESQYSDRDGDGGNSRSWWQISNIYHPEVSDECAYSLSCSTKWAIRRIRDGFAYEWSVFKFRCIWFPKEAPNCGG